MQSGPADRFLVEAFTPAYLYPAVKANMKDRVEAALAELRSCSACPRNCAVDRLADETKGAICRTGRRARVSSAFAHMGEENCLRGRRGSGTIFFSLCNLRCVFCQNWDISQRPNGRELDASEIADLMLELQQEGCHNINLVTPEHVVPQIVEALALAFDRGLNLPIVYNTSGYDALSSLKLMDGLVDIYMPDFKLWSRSKAARFLKAKDYSDRAREAIGEMHRQVGDLRFTPALPAHAGAHEHGGDVESTHRTEAEHGTDASVGMAHVQWVACRGVLVRHLVMPGLLDETREIFRWLAEVISPDTYVNIMAQYQPAYEVGMVRNPVRHAEINRLPYPSELEAAYAAAREVGLWRFDERGFPSQG